MPCQCDLKALLLVYHRQLRGDLFGVEIVTVQEQKVLRALKCSGERPSKNMTGS